MTATAPRPARSGRERSLRSRPFALLAALVALAGGSVVTVAEPAGAVVFNVTTTADSGAGSAREAFAQASGNQTNDTINLQAGATYEVCQSWSHNDTGRTLTVNGNGATVVRICPGPGGFINNSGAIQNWNKSTLILRDLTITGGDGGARGAVVSASALGGVTGDNELVLDGVRIIGNSGTSGGGGIFADGYVEVTDSVIADNHDTNFGGGIHIQGPSPATGNTLVIEDSVITGNEAGSSGGISAGGGRVAILDSDISGNRTLSPTGSVGGIVAEDLTLFYSSVTGNDSHGVGSGVVVQDDLQVLSSTISDNDGLNPSSGNDVGVMVGGDVNLTFATIVDNDDLNLRLQPDGDLTSFASVIGGAPQNCRFLDPIGTLTTAGYNVEDRDDCAFGLGVGDRTDVADLGLLPLADNGGAGLSHHPTWSGGLIDAVPGAQAPCASALFGFDQRQVNRPVGAGCEPGAVELSPDLLPAHPFTDVPPWVEDSVRWIWFHEYAEGWADGTYRPDLDISRAQVVRMLYRVAGAPDPSGLPPHGLTDVPAWVDDAVRWAVHDPPGAALPVMAGFADHTFRPTQPITRAQTIRAVYRLAGAPDVSGLPPHGLTDVPTWVEDAVRWAAYDPPGAPLPVMTGFADHTFRPTQPITRAQVTRALHRFSLLP